MLQNTHLSDLLNFNAMHHRSTAQRSHAIRIQEDIAARTANN